MRKAVKDYHPGQGALTRDPKKAKEGSMYSPSGVCGDATLATREKGRIVVEALVEAILAEIEELRKATPRAAARGCDDPSRPLRSARAGIVQR